MELRHDHHRLAGAVLEGGVCQVSSTRRCSRHTQRDSIDSSLTDDKVLSDVRRLAMDRFGELGGRGCSVHEESRVKKLVDEITVSRENRPRPADESLSGRRGIGIIGVRTRPTPWVRIPLKLNTDSADGERGFRRR